MTDLVGNTALAVPSNIYDPGMSDFTERAHERIREELSSIGTVYQITGSILATTKYGVRFDAVYAHVENDFLRIPVILEVRWDGDQKRMRYFTQCQSVFRDYQREFVPPTRGYGTDVLSGTEREVVDALFDRIRSHPAVTWQEDYYRLAPVSHNTFTLAGVGLTGGSAVASGALMATEVLGPWAVLTAPVVGLGAMLTQRKVMAEFNAAYSIYHEAQRKWNARPENVIPALLTGRAEMSVFMDALLSMCDHAGVEYHGELQVSPVVSVSRSRPPVTHKDQFRPEGCYDSGVVRQPAVSFQAIMPDYQQPKWILFDGNHLYHFKEGEEIHSRPSTVIPLSDQTQDDDEEARSSEVASSKMSMFLNEATRFILPSFISFDAPF